LITKSPEIKMGGESRKNTRVVHGGFTRLALSFAKETCFFFPCGSEEQNGSDAKEIKLAGAKGKDGVAIVFNNIVGFQQAGCKLGVADAFDKLGGFQVWECLAFQI
jgi:hypothetical protein